MPQFSSGTNHNYSIDSEDSSKIANLSALQERIKDGRGSELGIEVANMQIDNLQRLDFLLNIRGKTVLDFNAVEEEDAEQVSALKDAVLKSKEGSEEEKELMKQLNSLLSR